MKDNIGPFADYPQIVFDSGMLGNAKFTVELIGRYIEQDRVAGPDSDRPSGTHATNDRRFRHVPSIVVQIAFSHTEFYNVVATKRYQFLYIKSKIHHVAVLHDVLFALDAGEAFF